MHCSSRNIFICFHTWRKFLVVYVQYLSNNTTNSILLLYLHKTTHILYIFDFNWTFRTFNESKLIWEQKKEPLSLNYSGMTIPKSWQSNDFLTFRRHLPTYNHELGQYRAYLNRLLFYTSLVLNKGLFDFLFGWSFIHFAETWWSTRPKSKYRLMANEIKHHEMLFIAENCSD